MKAGHHVPCAIVYHVLEGCVKCNQPVLLAKYPPRAATHSPTPPFEIQSQLPNSKVQSGALNLRPMRMHLSSRRHQLVAETS